MLNDIHKNIVEQVLECGFAKSHIKDIFNKDEWFLAKEILKQIKNDTSLDVIIEGYKEIDKFFK